MLKTQIKSRWWPRDGWCNKVCSNLSSPGACNRYRTQWKMFSLFSHWLLIARWSAWKHVDLKSSEKKWKTQHWLWPIHWNARSHQHRAWSDVQLFHSYPNWLLNEAVSIPVLSWNIYQSSLITRFAMISVEKGSSMLWIPTRIVTAEASLDALPN